LVDLFESYDDARTFELQICEKVNKNFVMTIWFP